MYIYGFLQKIVCIVITGKFLVADEYGIEIFNAIIYIQVDVLTMSSAVLIDFDQVYQVRGKKVASTSKFDEIASHLKKASRQIKTEWNNFSAEQRDYLTDFAHSCIEPTQGATGFLEILKSKIYLLFLNLTSQRESFDACVDAIDFLVDTILDCIEQDDPGYQAVLSDTLEELRLNYERIPEVKPEDSSVWLRNIFDEAIAEV